MTDEECEKFQRICRAAYELQGWGFTHLLTVIQLNDTKGTNAVVSDISTHLKIMLEMQKQLSIKEEEWG